MALGKGLNSLIAPSRGKNEDEKKIEEHSINVPSKNIPNVSLPLSHFKNRKEDSHQFVNSSSSLPFEARRDHGGNKTNEAIFHIEIEKIRSNPYQPRKFFNEEELNELADSIKEFGVIQPLIASKVVSETPHGTMVEYQLIAGERRLMASKKAGLERVPVIIRKMNTPKMKLEIALIENIQRSNLNPLESARAYARLQDEFGLTQKEIAIRVGKSREVVANTMRLLNLPPIIQNAIEEGKINESQARGLLSLNDSHEQKIMFERMLSGVMSARKMRERIEQKKIIDPEQLYWQKRFEEILGLPIEFVKRGTRGKISIQFYSEEEFNSIIEKLLGKEEHENQF